MKTQTVLATVAALIAQVSVAQTNGDLFVVKFHVKCTPAVNQGKGDSAVMTEKSLISQSLAANGGTSSNLNGFQLVYDPAADAIEVVSAADGSVVSQVFLFQTRTNIVSNNKLSRFVFVFGPDDGTAVGSAVITEKAMRNGNAANINGQIQLTMHASGVAATSANGNASLTAPTATGSGSTEVSSNSTTVNNNVVTATSFVESTAVTAPVGTEEICVGVFSAHRRFETLTAQQLAALNRKASRKATTAATTTTNTVTTVSTNTGTTGTGASMTTGTNATTTTTTRSTNTTTRTTTTGTTTTPQINLTPPSASATMTP